MNIHFTLRYGNITLNAYNVVRANICLDLEQPSRISYAEVLCPADENLPGKIIDKVVCYINSVSAYVGYPINISFQRATDTQVLVRLTMISYPFFLLRSQLAAQTWTSRTLSTLESSYLTPRGITLTTTVNKNTVCAEMRVKTITTEFTALSDFIGMVYQQPLYASTNGNLRIGYRDSDGLYNLDSLQQSYGDVCCSKNIEGVMRTLYIHFSGLVTSRSSDTARDDFGSSYSRHIQYPTGSVPTSQMAWENYNLLVKPIRSAVTVSLKMPDASSYSLGHKIALTDLACGSFTGYVKLVRFHVSRQKSYQELQLLPIAYASPSLL